MLTLENLREFAKKFQTSERNILREYVQHLFLSELYKVEEAKNLLFKGGTSLRFIYRSPRFSEDIDFTGQSIFNLEIIDDLFLKALSELEKIGVAIEIAEAKPTTGGYLGLIHYELYGLSENMKFEVSLRKGKKVKGELTMIISDFVSPYTIIHLPAKDLACGKIAALLDRRKPRDYYDLYFLLRHYELNKFVDKKVLYRVLENLSEETIDFKRELSALLPASHQLILKNFKEVLGKEIKGRI